MRGAWITQTTRPRCARTSIASFPTPKRKGGTTISTTMASCWDRSRRAWARLSRSGAARGPTRWRGALRVRPGPGPLAAHDRGRESPLEWAPEHSVRRRRGERPAVPREVFRVCGLDHHPPPPAPRADAAQDGGRPPARRDTARARPLPAGTMPTSSWGYWVFPRAGPSKWRRPAPHRDPRDRPRLNGRGRSTARRTPSRPSVRPVRPARRLG
jgi:hypothetical protein